LAVLDLVNERNPADGKRGLSNTLAPEPWSHSLFDSPVILCDHSMERAVRPHDKID
jgi:hypothetical protein